MSIVTELKSQIKLIYDKIDAIQEACSHPQGALVVIAKSDTGGYDGPQSDSYWNEFECRLCEKKWVEDQK